MKKTPQLHHVATGTFVIVWAPPDSNRRPTGYASHYDFRRPFRVCGLDCPFTLVEDRGCLPSSLYTFPPVAGLARDYHTIRWVRLPRV